MALRKKPHPEEPAQRGVSRDSERQAMNLAALLFDVARGCRGSPRSATTGRPSASAPPAIRPAIRATRLGDSANSRMPVVADRGLPRQPARHIEQQCGEFIGLALRILETPAARAPQDEVFLNAITDLPSS